MPQDLVEETTYDEDGEAVHKVRRSNTGMFTQLISDARAAEWEYVKPHDTDRLFYRLAWWKKVIVMAGGPMVNIAIAFSLFVLLFATYGNPRDEVDRADRRLGPRVRDPGRGGRPRLHRRGPGDPGRARPGIQPGDVIVSFNGTPFERLGQLPVADPRQRRRRRGDRGAAATASCSRSTTNTTVTLRQTSIEDETLTEVGFLGVQPEIHLATGGPALHRRPDGDDDGRDASRRSASCRSRSTRSASAIVGLQERDPESPVSIVGGGRFAGEAAASEQFPLTEKLVTLLFLIASFNFFIGMFNFIPCCRSTAATSPARSTRASSAASPACAAAPTPVTSTSPSCCRWRTSWGSRCS